MEKYTMKFGTRVYKIVSGMSGVFAVTTGENFVVVDTGVKAKKRVFFEKIEAFINKGYRLRGLILTHTHVDHVGNASEFNRRYQTDIYAHKNEVACSTKGIGPPAPFTNTFVKTLSKPFENTIDRFSEYEPFSLTHFVEDTYSLGGIGIDGHLLHTPGHTTGSLSLVVAGEIAIVGDAAFGLLPRNAYPPIATDEEEVLHSWKKLLDTRCKLFLPSHGKVITKTELLRQYHNRAF